MSKERLLSAIVICLGWPVLLLSAAGPQSSFPEPQAGSRPFEPSIYVLGPDDQIVVHVVDVPEISGKTQRLDPSGNLGLPMIGRVHAAGLTVEQLEAEITRRLKAYLQQPDVSVTLVEPRSQPVSLIGAVRQSGVHQLSGQRTLIEVLSMAGGVREDAGPTLRLMRRLQSGPIPLPGVTVDEASGISTADIDLRALLDARTPEQNIVVRPFDIISIGRAEAAYVVGEVGKPGPVYLQRDDSVSVIEAVSSSGGMLRTADASRARLLRQVPGGQRRVELAVDLNRIMQGKAEDLRLKAGDILVVPDSSGKRLTARAIEAAIQAGTWIGSYGIFR